MESKEQAAATSHRGPVSVMSAERVEQAATERAKRRQLCIDHLVRQRTAEGETTKVIDATKPAEIAGLAVQVVKLIRKKTGDNDGCAFWVMNIAAGLLFGPGYQLRRDA